MTASVALGCILGSAQVAPSRMLWTEDVRLEDGQWTREFDPEIPWTELVVSWNAEVSGDGQLIVTATPEGSKNTYTLGIWTADKKTRRSVNKQKTEEARVATDTLIAHAPKGKVAITLQASEGSVDVRLLTLSFSTRSEAEVGGEVDRGVWGKVLEPPKRAQMSYPNGKVLCSPTAVSMALGYWAEKLTRPEIDRDVPVVVEGVFDLEWPGTGNWPFNTAFAGTVPGMRAYVARFWGTPQLEAWIRRDIPVICSVSNGLLQGKGKGSDDGHLVLLVGFTVEGDPVFNDPGRNVVRMTYKRADFEAAWASSGRTCYLIYPKYYAPPENKDRCWVD